MDFNEYQAAAMRTAAKTEDRSASLATAGLGVAGEAGEVADAIKKLLFHGHPFDEAAREKLVREAGDVLWYLALLADTLGVSLEEIAQRNVEKLRLRYPEGFSSQRSLERPAEG